MQWRFTQRHGVRAARLLQHKRFRAAYDFFMLRARCGEVEREAADWWTEIQQLPPEEQQKVIGSKRRQGRRRRRGRGRRAEHDDERRRALTGVPVGALEFLRPHRAPNTRAIVDQQSTSNAQEVIRLDGPRFIVVEGPIGVGKTSLARRLAQSFAGELVLEQAAENPFLERFYRNPRAAALPTQLFFLFQRARQLEQHPRSRTCSRPCAIADYLLEKDRLFARADAR